MAKESLEDNLFTEKSDLFALGMTFYELLEAQEPRSGLTSQQAARKTIKGERPPTSQEINALPETLTKESSNNVLNELCRRSLYDMMKKCWNQDMFLRPTAATVYHG